MMAMFVLLFAQAIGTPAAACECLCVNGELQTVCDDFALAREGRRLCLDHPHCGSPALAPLPDTPISPPDLEVQDCRWVHVWRPGALDSVDLPVKPRKLCRPGLR